MTPREFRELLDKEQRWFETLMLIGIHRLWAIAHDRDDSVEQRTIAVMLADRARQLRN